MISEDTIEAYNKRLTFDTSNAKKLTASQRDAVKSYGSQAEALLLNRELAMFIHHFKFEINDSMVGITSHTVDANAERVALANQLCGIDSFINTLKLAVHRKNKMLVVEREGL